ncbi:hypothetical protein HNQ36_002759 [Afipia massiliensis]|uniref:Uncharacterized protein n=1 Tax=Afipia massiliensis TaxID=211460 RepID=A0A840MY70_9BRAD|nr:hypothetical protein [Afipia massiliensis]MBB5052785.1 hypothetical protein [Afipia massiliensis]
MSGVGHETGKSGRISRGAAVVGAAALVLIIGYFAFRWVSPAPEEKSVAQQWNEAISRLGIEPVYPPQEDISVGDVFVILTEDALGNVEKEPLAGRAMKLWHIDMTEKLERAYSEIYRFPETADPPSEGKPWKFAAAEGSVFKSKSPRTDLPLVLFPGFTIASTRSADLSGSWAQGFKTALGGSAASALSTEVKIAAAETYGLSTLVSEAALEKFCTDAVYGVVCTDAGARRQMSIIVGNKIYDEVKDPASGRSKPRFSVEIALVTRVFLARSIRTTIRRAGSANATGSATEGDAIIPANSPKAENAKPGDAPPDLLAKQPAAIVPGSPGVVTSLQFGNSSIISTVETLQRPVAFGYRSVRWQPGGAQ